MILEQYEVEEIITDFDMSISGLSSLFQRAGELNQVFIWEESDNVLVSLQEQGFNTRTLNTGDLAVCMYVIKDQHTQVFTDACKSILKKVIKPVHAENTLPCDGAPKGLIYYFIVHVTG